MKKILLILITFMFVSCDQTITRNFGGTTEIKIQQGYKLIEVTWKEDDLWYLIEPMEENYISKDKMFIESSVLGVFQGKVVFKESK